MGINFPNAPSVGQQWPVPPVAGQPVWQWDGEKWGAGPPTTPFYAVMGQCVFKGISTSTVALYRMNGSLLTINGVNETVPAAGITFPVTGLTVSTLYYFYAYMNAGVMTLEASTTAHTTHTNGSEIKNGDPTRTLIGMAFVVSGPTFQDSNVQRLVRSWFNDSGTTFQNGNSATSNITSTSLVEIDSSMRTFMLMWANEAVLVIANVGVNNNVVGAYSYLQAGWGSFGGAAGAIGTNNFTQHPTAYYYEAISNAGSVIAGVDGCYFATLMGMVTGNTSAYVWKSVSGSSVRRQA